MENVCIRHKSKIVYSLGVIIILYKLSSVAQTTALFNNGADFYVGSPNVLHVNGTFQNDNSAGTSNVFENNGVMTVANSTTSGNIELTSNSTLQGNGTYFVEKDWINDAIFISSTSVVNLNGNTQQFITSTNNTVTTFNDLVLSGVGIGINRKKTLQFVDAQLGILGTLSINDREFETGLNTLFVLNPSSTCITNSVTLGSEGFVSSSFNSGGSGYLSRATNSTATYLFPTGSSLGTTRYRPIEVTPASASVSTYTARLGNNNATVDGFNTTSLDSNLWIVNSSFYHELLGSSGSDNATIEIYYDSSSDGLWDGVANWNSPYVALWNNMGLVTANSNIPLNSILKDNWTDFSDSPYVLSLQKSTTPVFVCELAIIPNVFSPDGDGINDLFFVNNTCLESFLLEIYNRWGTKIYESRLGGWDGYTTAGQPADDGIYFYIFKGISSISQKDYNSKGALTLVRGYK